MSAHTEYQRYLDHKRACLLAIQEEGFGSFTERIHQGSGRQDLYCECGPSKRFRFTDEDWELYFSALDLPH